VDDIEGEGLVVFGAQTLRIFKNVFGGTMGIPRNFLSLNRCASPETIYAASATAAHLRNSLSDGSFLITVSGISFVA